MMSPDSKSVVSLYRVLEAKTKFNRKRWRNTTSHAARPGPGLDDENEKEDARNVFISSAFLVRSPNLEELLVKKTIMDVEPCF